MRAQFNFFLLAILLITFETSSAFAKSSAVSGSSDPLCDPFKEFETAAGYQTGCDYEDPDTLLAFGKNGGYVRAEAK